MKNIELLADYLIGTSYLIEYAVERLQEIEYVEFQTNDVSELESALSPYIQRCRQCGGWWDTSEFSDESEELICQECWSP